MKSYVSSVPNMLRVLSPNRYRAPGERVAIVVRFVNVNMNLSVHQRLKALKSFDDVELGLCRIVHEWPPGGE